MLHFDFEVTFRKGSPVLEAMQQQLCKENDEEDYTLIVFEVYTVGNPKANLEPARLVSRAAEPWSPATHELFPDEKRAFARFLLLLGVRFRSVYGLPMHLMIDVVMPAVVKRETGKPGDGQYVTWMMDHEFGERF